MKKINPVSFRPLLLTASVDFLKQERMECLITQEGIPELISHLLYYKEEGRSLYPEIFIFDDIELVRKFISNAHFCVIGKGNKSKETMLKALKKCAPLTENGWAVYILRKDTEFEYGVFRAGITLLSLSISDGLVDEKADKLKVILVHQVSDKLIEIKGIKADTILVNYSNQVSISDSPIINQIEFIKTITLNINNRYKEQSENFFRKLFLEVLQKGHGTLACVIKGQNKTLPKKLGDGIYLEPRINVPKIIKDLISKNDLQTNFQLEGYFSLISGMMQSDGITVFTDRGEIVSFNVFLKYPKKIATTKTSGGARSRTYLALCEMLNKGIKSAYIQSQDGKIEYKNG